MNRETAQARIDFIDEVLAQGFSSVTHNGRTVTYDLPAMRRERDRLQGYLNKGRGGRNVRKGVYNINY